MSKDTGILKHIQRTLIACDHQLFQLSCLESCLLCLNDIFYPTILGNQSGFIAKFHPEMVKGFERIKEIVEARNAFQIVDARPGGRFHGTSPEPRPEIPSGHMPGSLSVPFMECLNESRELKSADELQSLFMEKGVDLGKDMVASCGSGVSACILALSVYVSSNKDIPVYDGSWTEWATKIPSLIEKD